MICSKIMCDENIHNKKDYMKWLLKNHPDKNSNVNIDNKFFTEINKCHNKGLYCDKKNKTKKNLLKTREKVFSTLRKTANFGKINPYHKFDKKEFDVDKFNKDVVDTSPKMIQLLKNIKELDHRDMQEHGKKFKHFIFSDVKEGGYGAKIIASALIADGYNNVITTKIITKTYKGQVKKYLTLNVDTNINSNNNFGLLSSNTVYKCDFSEKIKKELLALFNERPGNIYGQKLRIIVFDSGFKEGIDLFDVKYVHIFEPSLTIADLKQTIGRATRTCGQKGLEFLPNIGWPLYVYNYYLTIPEITQETFLADKYLAYNIDPNTLNDPNEKFLIFKHKPKLGDVALMYSKFDVAMLNLSKQLYELAPALSVDYILTNNLHEIDDLNAEIMDKEIYMMLGGTAKNVHKNLNVKSKFYKINSINCIGKCGKKSTKDIPVSLNFMHSVYNKYKHPKKILPKTQLRNFFCKYMRDNSEYCKQLNQEWSIRYANIVDIIEKNKNIDKIKKEFENNDIILDDDTDDDVVEQATYPLILYKGVNEPKLKLSSSSSSSSSSSISSSFNDTFKHKMNFKEMRNYIKTNYYNKNFVWDKIEIVNKCLPQPNTSTSTSNSNQIQLNPTQKFITHFFTPQSPLKGLLLWHSVGTGKTCSGVSIASSNFEKAGYSILWVTRTTLKGDIWKNIFDQICHDIIRDEVNKGLILPSDLTARKKLLSKSWFEPMSYKQFSNLLDEKNTIFEKLKLKNGTSDILKKTLIIIDEAHKLYGGDLKAAEKPDTDIMEKLIMNSYTKSGKDSCKLLIMTATPFTNSPLELFQLTNLFMENEQDKIIIDKEHFKELYMTQDNILSQSGLSKIADKLAGYISYLNREKDPTQFAQPIMINVPVLLQPIDDKYREILFLNKKINDIKTNNKQVIAKFKKILKDFKTETKNIDKNITKLKKEKADKCLPKHCPNNHAIDQCKLKYTFQINKLQTELDNINKNIEEIEQQITYYSNTDLQSNKDFIDIKKNVDLIKKSIIQEYMIFKKAEVFYYNTYNMHKSTQKLLLK